MKEKDIVEIAELIECGMVCYYHRSKEKILYLSNPNDPYFEPEPFQDIIDEVEENRDEYEMFEQMTSTEGFQVMEDFANAITDDKLGDKLFNGLSRRKPFQNFKYIIDNSDFRQDWFDFRKKANIAFVKQQLSQKN